MIAAGSVLAYTDGDSDRILALHCGRIINVMVRRFLISGRTDDNGGEVVARRHEVPVLMRDANHLRFAMLQAVGDRIPTEAAENGNQDCAGAKRADQDRDRFNSPREHHRNPIALLNTEPSEKVGELRALLCQLPEPEEPLAPVSANPVNGGTVGKAGLQMAVDHGPGEIDLLLAQPSKVSQSR